jgi:hypothetical protein
MAIEASNLAMDKKDRKKQWDDEIISFEFMNLEEPGVPIKFVFGKMPRPQKYTLLHGGKYKLPRTVVNHIESRQMPIWKYTPDGEGRMAKRLTGYKSRFQCRQLFE